MKLMSDLIPMKLYSSNRKVMLPVNERDKKRGSVVFLMGQSMEDNQKMIQLPYLFKGSKLFRSYYIDRDVANYINSENINLEDESIEESSIVLKEGIIHTNKDFFTFINAGTMDMDVLNNIFNLDTVKWCMKKLDMRKPPMKNITVRLYKSEEEIQKFIKKRIDTGESYIYSYTEGTTIHILQNLAYDEKNMDGPYDLYCIHELIYCLIINEYPTIHRKIATCTAMALSGQVEWFRKKADVDQFKYHHSDDAKIDGLYAADVILGIYNTKGSVNIRRFLEGDTGYFYSVAGRRVAAWFDSSLKESLVEGTLTAKDKSKLNDSDYGIPSKKKYPMPDETHVRAAIRMFNHCDKEDEAELANAIKRKMKKFNITDVKISDKNRLSQYITEGVLINKDDTEYNLNLWSKGNHNVLYITGLSGGGKSTTAQKMSKKYHAAYIELDRISHAFDFKGDPKEDRVDEQLIDEYIRKNNITKDPMKMNDEDYDKYFFGCFYYMLSEIHKDKNFLYIVEGIQIIKIAKNDPSIFNEPMIIKNTSMLTSIIRRLKRDGEIKISDKSNIINAIKWYIDQEYSLNCLRSGAKEFNESTLDRKYFNISYNKEPDMGSQMGFYHGKGEKKRWNSIVKINGKNYRERSEILLIKDGKIFISKQKDGSYKVPGGGTEPEKTCKEQCIRECQEEALITPKNLKYVLTYNRKYENPDEVYYGQLTYLYIGEYDRKFTGKVADTDKDSRISKGDFYEIEEIYDDLIEPHRKALLKYFNIKESAIVNELSVSNNIKVDFEKKNDMSLSKFTRKDLDDSIVEKYHLIHVDILDPKSKGEAYIDKDENLVAYINVKEKDDGTIWIQGLEVSKDYRGHGLSTQLLKRAVDHYKVTNLSVNTKNQVAYNLYKKNGFTEYRRNGKMIFMNTEATIENKSAEEAYLEYDENGNPFIGNHPSEYYSVLEILSTLPKKEFDIVSLFPVYRDVAAIKKRIVLKDPNGVPMSFMDVYWFKEKPNEAQITTAVSGYYRGNNLCAMMLKELLDSGFAEKYNIDTFVWNAHPTNEVSKHIATSHGFELTSKDIDRLGRQRYEYHTSLYDDKVDLKKLPESATMSLDESSIFIFREADDVEAQYDKKLKRYLYKERLKNNREILPLYEKIKVNNPDIDRTYRDLKLYNGQNVYVDTSYYHGLYLQNVNVKNIKRGLYMYLDFLTRLMDNKDIKNKYQKITYFFPVFSKFNVDLLDWKSDVNILSAICYFAKKDPYIIKKWVANKNIVFLGTNGYFVVDFNNFNAINLNRFKSHVNKLLSNMTIIDNDPIEDDFIDDTETESKGAAVVVLDKLEKKGIKIDDISKVSSINKISHLVMNTNPVKIDKKPQSTAIMVLTPNSKTFESEIEDKTLKSKDITTCYRPRIES